MYIIDLIYTIVLFLLIARLFLIFTHQTNGKFYDFVFQSSEFMLKPIRNILPKRSFVDYSPLVLLLVLHFLKNFLNIGIPLLVNGQIIKFFLAIIFTIINILISINFFMIIIYIIKLIMSKTLNNPMIDLTNMFSGLTVPLENFIFRKFKFLQSYYKNKEIVMIIIFIITNFILSNFIKNFIILQIYN